MDILPCLKVMCFSLTVTTEAPSGGNRSTAKTVLARLGFAVAAHWTVSMVLAGYAFLLL